MRESSLNIQLLDRRLLKVGLALRLDFLHLQDRDDVLLLQGHASHSDANVISVPGFEIRKGEAKTWVRKF